jgi:hypothetical protein
MIYTAVFQDREGSYTLEACVSSHDRNVAWHSVHEERTNKDTCLVLLIDGQANVKTYAETLDSDK